MICRRGARKREIRKRGSWLGEPVRYTRAVDLEHVQPRSRRSWGRARPGVIDSTQRPATGAPRWYRARVRLPTTLDRVALLAAGLALGLAAPAVAPGCILNDTCIVVTTPGTDWCVVIEDALMWPVGQPDLAEPVSGPGGGAPRGCQCFNDADVAILSDGLPADVFGGLVGEIQADARNKCALAVPPGFDHNCYVEDGSLAPSFGLPHPDDPSDACIGSCAYINPPRNGSCGDDPDPYECNEEYGGGDTGAEQATDTGGGGGGTGDVSPVDLIPGATEVLR